MRVCTKIIRALSLIVLLSYSGNSMAEFTPIRRAMDLGPCGLLILTVDSEETMRVIQDAVYLKPRDRRRAGKSLGRQTGLPFMFDRRWK